MIYLEVEQTGLSEKLAEKGEEKKAINPAEVAQLVEHCPVYQKVSS